MRKLRRPDKHKTIVIKQLLLSLDVKSNPKDVNNLQATNKKQQRFTITIHTVGEHALLDGQFIR